MSLKNVTSPEKNISVLELHIDKAAFDDAVTKAYKKNVGKMNVPGFRKGKAPKSIIEKMYGAAVFYDDALDMLLPDLYASAVEEAKLEVVSRPEIDIVSIDENGVELTAKVYTKPVATVSKYKGLEAAKETVRVNKSEIEEEIELVRKRNGRQITLEDQPAADGDETVIDFEGFLDGVAFEGGKGEKFPLKLGSGSFIPGFEEQMVGMNIGEEKDLNVTFPTEYHAKELAGKEAVFHVKVNGITETQLPALDDDFAKDISEFDTLDAYKADVRAKLEAQAAERDNNVFTNAVIGKVMENATVEIPEAMIERQIDSMIRNFEARLAQQGLKLADFMKYTGQDEKSFRGQYRDQAEKSVRANLVLEAIENVENFEVSDEEIDAEIEKFAKQIGQSVEELKKNLTEGDREYFKADVIRDKAVKFLCDNAKAE